MVDWVNGAKILNYYKAVANTRLVGAQVGFLVKALEDSYNILRADVHLIGFSLGAHTAGYAGKLLTGIGRISGKISLQDSISCVIYIRKTCP